MAKPTSPHTPVEPPRLARPLSGEELRRVGSDQIVREINAVLAGILAHNLGAPRPHASIAVGRRETLPNPWARADDDRRHQLLFLDGPRGSGKTALLVTLLNAWNDTQQRDDEPFESVGGLIRALPILDFEPLPPKLPLHAWLVEALHPLVISIEARGAADIATASRQGSSSAWLEGDDDDVTAMWNRLRTTALVGWSEGTVLGAARDGDLEAALMWAGDQEQLWVGLPSRWREFVDRLLEALERAQVLPKGAVVVLPVDDVDLEVKRVRELLLALRLFRHSRLVFLIAGDLKHLEQMVHRAFLTDLHPMDGPDGEFRAGAGDLAREFVRKTLHPAHTWRMPELPLALVVQENILDLRGVLSEVPAGSTDFAAVLGGLDPSPCLTLRALEQLRDVLARGKPDAAIDVAERLLRNFSGKAEVRRAGGTLRVVIPGANITAAVSGTRVIESGSSVRLISATAVRYFLRTDDGDPVELPPDLALATELSMRGMLGIVVSPSLPSRDTLPLLWARWRGIGTSAVFPAGLPEAEPPSGLKVWVSDWAAILLSLPPPLTAAVVWWYWIRFALLRQYPSTAVGLLSPTEEPDLRKAWQALVHRVWTIVEGSSSDATIDIPRDDAWRNWLQGLMSRLGCPEYGLPEVIQMDILRFVLVKTAPMPTRQLRFIFEPGASFRDALGRVQAARASAARTDFSTPEPDSRVLQEVDAAFPLSPWRVCRAVVAPHSWWPWIEVPTIAARVETPLLAMRIGQIRYGVTLKGQDRTLGAFLHVRQADGCRWHSMTAEIGNLVLAADDPGDMLRAMGKAVDGRQVTEAAPLMVDLWKTFAPTLKLPGRVRRTRAFEISIDRAGTGLVFKGLQGVQLVASHHPEAMRVLPGLALARWSDWECREGSPWVSGVWRERPALAWIGALQSFAADQGTESGIVVRVTGALLELDGVGIPHPNYPAWIDYELLTWHVFEKMLNELEERTNRGDDHWALKSWALLCFLDRCVDLILGDRYYASDRHPLYLPTFPATARQFTVVAEQLLGQKGRCGPWVSQWLSALAPLIETWVPAQAMAPWQKLLVE